jgi:hypothetical protein
MAGGPSQPDAMPFIVIKAPHFQLSIQTSGSMWIVDNDVSWDSE